MLMAIKDWGEHFESAASRKLKAFTFAPLPIRQGSFYVEMMLEPNKYELYACWCQILCVAAAAKPRGVLTRGNGKPHTAKTLAHQARMDEDAMQRALDFAISQGRLILSNDLPSKSHSNATQIPFKSQSDAANDPDKEGRKEGKKEGREEEGAAAPKEIPPPPAAREKAEETPGLTIKRGEESGTYSVATGTLPALSPADIIGAWDAITAKTSSKADIEAARELAPRLRDIGQVQRAARSFLDSIAPKYFPFKTFANQFDEHDRPPKPPAMEAAIADADRHAAAIADQAAKSVTTDNLAPDLQAQLAKLKGTA